MKTLNRPMFRYGGPIKEGVMNGIREPKRNGGSMGNDEGPRRAALVGNPIYPKGPDGRTGHFVPVAIGLGLRGAGAIAARLAARKLKTEMLTPKNYNKYVKPLLRDKNLKYKDYRKRYPDVKGVGKATHGYGKAMKKQGKK